MSALKIIKLKINDILVEKYKVMLENPNFEQNIFFSKTSTGINNIGHDSLRILKWFTHNDRSYYININYYDRMGSVLKISNELS